VSSGPSSSAGALRNIPEAHRSPPDVRGCSRPSPSRTPAVPRDRGQEPTARAASQNKSSSCEACRTSCAHRQRHHWVLGGADRAHVRGADEKQDEYLRTSTLRARICCPHQRHPRSLEIEAGRMELELTDFDLPSDRECRDPLAGTSRAPRYRSHHVSEEGSVRSEAMNGR